MDSNFRADVSCVESEEEGMKFWSYATDKMFRKVLKTTKQLSRKTSGSLCNVDQRLMTAHVHGYVPLNQQVVLDSDFNLSKQYNVT